MKRKIELFSNSHRVMFWALLLAGQVQAENLESWEALAPLTVARHDLQLVAHEGMLYAISGAHDLTVTDVDAYDPAENLWTARAPIPGKRGWFGAAGIGGHIFCAGGKFVRTESERQHGGDARPYHYLDSLNVYDPVADRWRVGPPMRAARAGCHAAALNRELYMIGGSLPGAGFLDRVEIYSPEQDAWRDAPPLPDKREDMGVVSIEDKLYVIGGVRHALRADVFIFDRREQLWTHGAPMPAPRRSFAVAAEGARVWCIGGVGQQGYLDSVEVYDTRTDRWTTGPRLPHAGAWMGAAVLDGRLYVAGGADYDDEKKRYNWRGNVYALTLPST
ncbi:MAG: hypothetical protein O2901_14095 [Verrucomicrobia bacterium]|nr:hypothetical protein [Verrucomicrobiota bacterium]